MLFIDDGLLNIKAARAVGLQVEGSKGVNGAKQVLVAYNMSLYNFVSNKACICFLSYPLMQALPLPRFCALRIPS